MLLLGGGIDSSLEGVEEEIDPLSGNAVVDRHTGRISLELSDGRWCTFRAAGGCVPEGGKAQDGISGFARLLERLRGLYGPRLRLERIPRLSRLEKAIITAAVLFICCAVFTVALAVATRPR
jgi:hypothetical protein